MGKRQYAIAITQKNANFYFTPQNEGPQNFICDLKIFLGFIASLRYALCGR